MDSYWVYACSQHPCESTYEYFERYKCYLDEYPDHGFQLHELITDFLDGMLPEECYTLRSLAGRPLMDCTPRELWSLIEERAESTRPYTECSTDIVEMVYQLSKQVAAIGEVNYGLLQGAPETTQFFVDDEEVPLSTKNRDNEDVVDAELQVEEKLQVVPVMSMEDDSAKEWSSLPCPDIILEQKLVITRNPIILPLSSIFLSSSAQIGNHQVWCSLEKTEIHDPMVRTHMITQASDQVFDELCINWKTRKKSMGKVQNSVKRSNNHSGDFRPAFAPMKLRPNWKERKKGKCFITNSEFSIFAVNVQKNRASFGWKPGWKLWKNASHNVARKVRKDVRKYDGIHPWAPNI